MKKRLSGGDPLDRGEPASRASRNGKLSLANSRLMPSVTADQRHAVEPAPGRVALQRHAVAGIETQPQPVDHDLGHRRHVTQGQVPALSGDRVNAARRIADQGQRASAVIASASTRASG